MKKIGYALLLSAHICFVALSHENKVNQDDCIYDVIVVKNQAFGGDYQVALVCKPHEGQLFDDNKELIKELVIEQQRIKKNRRIKIQRPEMSNECMHAIVVRAEPVSELTPWSEPAYLGKNNREFKMILIEGNPESPTLTTRK